MRPQHRAQDGRVAIVAAPVGKLPIHAASQELHRLDPILGNVHQIKLWQLLKCGFDHKRLQTFVLN